MHLVFPLGAGCAGAGRVSVSFRVFLRSTREEALDRAEAPRDAQLPCHCAWARMRSLSCSSRGSLLLGGLRGPSTWGGLSFQVPRAGAHAS